MNSRFIASIAGLALCILGASASAQVFSGRLDDPSNPALDFGYAGVLAAGVYRLAIGAFANLSFAENFGSGTLADGFTALGTPGSLGDAGYRVVVAKPVPEASQWALLLVGLLTVGFATRSGPLRTGAAQARASRWPAIGLVAGLAMATPLLHAAEASGSVRTYAQDAPRLPNWDEHVAGGRSSNPPVVSYAVDSLYGDSMAHAEIAIDGLTGAMRARFTSQVGATSALPGRGATATGAASLTGSIGIVGPAAPGAATFNAVLEGTYSADPLSFDSSIGMDYSFRVGASPEFNGRRDYRRSSGTFSIPFTWTQSVQAGDTIDFSLYLRGSATASFGLAELVALNTFKITAIDLPPGYGFTPDADGFLSKFGAAGPIAPVPEPATAALAGIGLLAVAWARRRVANRRRL